MKLKINDFIKVRGEIAHNGSKAQYVRYDSLLNNIQTVADNVIQIDYSISQFLKKEYSGVKTWEETYSMYLSSYNK